MMKRPGNKIDVLRFYIKKTLIKSAFPVIQGQGLSLAIPVWTCSEVP